MHKKKESLAELYPRIFSSYARQMCVGICLDLLSQYKSARTQGFSFSNQEEQDSGDLAFQKEHFSPRKAQVQYISVVAIEYHLLYLLRSFYNLNIENIKIEDILTSEEILPGEEIPYIEDFPNLGGVKEQGEIERTLSVAEIQNFMSALSHFFFFQIEEDLGENITVKMVQMFKQKNPTSQHVNRKSLLDLNIPTKLQKSVTDFAILAQTTLERRHSNWLACKGFDKLSAFP